MYIRNDNLTHVLVGDVYRSNQVWSSVDLRVGLVGLVVPLRGAGQAAFSCQVLPAPSGIVVHPPRLVPDLLELDDLPGRGLMLSNVFALPVHNAQSHSVTVEFFLEKPPGLDREFFVRPARGAASSGSADPPTLIASGQTVSLSLEILPSTPVTAAEKGLFLNCGTSRAFTLHVTPSRGQQAKTTLEFACRRQNQSLSVSFVDHDGSVAQAAVILPIRASVK